MEEQGRPDTITKAANSTTPGIPRQIRARTGQTTDPLPEGMQLEEKKLRFPIEPAEHDVERTKPKAPEELGVSEGQLSTRVNAKAEGEDASQLVAQELAHRNTVEEMKWRDLRRQQGAMVQRDIRQAEAPPSRSMWQGTSTAANKQMDSRSGPRP